MSQLKTGLHLHSIVTCATIAGRAHQDHLVTVIKKAFGKVFLGCFVHYGKLNIRMPLRGPTGKGCFTLIVVLFATGGFVMMIFQKKKINVLSVVGKKVFPDFM